MKNKYILSAALVTLFAIAANAQEGFGTNNPDPSSVIDMTSKKRGVLIPRVKLSATNVASPVTAPANSLMVYNTETTGTAPNNVVPGFYYWLTNRWVRITNVDDIIKGNITSSDLNVTGGTDATFTNVTLEIKDDAITTNKIAPGAVETSDIKDHAVTPVKLDGTGFTPGYVATVQANGSVTYAAPSATATNITSDKNLTAGDASIVIGGTGTGALLQNANVSVANGGITEGKLANNAVTSDKIKDGEVKLDDLATGSVDSSKIVDDSVTSSDIKDLTITGSDIAGNTVTSDKLNSGGAGTGTVPTVNSDGSVTYQPINAANLANRKDLKAAADAVESIEVASGGTNAVLVETTLRVKDLGITNGKLADNAVNSVKIANETILSEDIKDGEVKTTDIADKNVTAIKLVANAADDNKVATAHANGTVTYETVKATDVSYVNTASGLTATTVQGAIDQIVTLGNTQLNNNNLTDEGDGKVTLTRPNGTKAKVNKSDISYNSGTGVYTFTNGDTTDVNFGGGDITSTDLTVTGGANAAFTDVTLDIKAGAVTAAKLGANGTTDANKVATAHANGTVTYETPTTDATNVSNAKNLTAGDLSVTIGGSALGVGATLVPVSVMVAANGITTDKIKDGEVGTTDLAADAVDNSKLADNAVQTENIAANAVETSDIKDGAVTVLKLNSGSALVGKVAKADGAGGVVFGDIPSSSVTGANMTPADASVAVTGGTGATLVPVTVGVAANGITTDKIKDGEVKLADLDANSVDSSKIVNESILSEDIKDGEVTSADIKDLTITGADIAIKTISADKLIADGVNDAGKVATVNSNGTVTYQTVAADAANVTNGKPLTSTDLSVSSPEGATALLKAVAIDIKALAVTNGKIAPDAITTDKIKDGEVKLADLASSSVDSSKIVDESIISADIKDGEVKTSDIADKNVTAIKMSAGSVTAGSPIRVPLADNNGDITYGTLPSSSVTGANMTPADASVAVTGGTGATLVPVTVGVATNGITTDKIKDGEVKLADLDANSVDSSKIVNESILSEDIKDLTITGADIATKTISADKLIADGVNDAGKVATVNSNGTVTYQTVAADVANITNGKNLTNGGDTSITIGGTALGVGTLLKDATVSITNLGVTNGKIAADAITTDKIATDAVQTSDIKDKNVTPAKMQPGGVDQVLATNSAGTDVVWVNKSTLALEPWLVQATTPTVQGSAYADNLTTNGTIAIKKAQVLSGAILDVAGAVRGGVNTTGTVGTNSAAFGNANTASGTSAFAAGASNTASGASAVALGQSNTASAANTTALGQSNTVSAANATAIGQTNTASGNGSTVGGFNNTASSQYETVFGTYNGITTGTAASVVATDALFQVGNGTSTTRSSALTILKNGNTGLGLTLANKPTERLHVAAGNVRINDIVTNAGTTSDKIVVADASGVLKTVSALSTIGAGDITGGTEITVGNGVDSAFKDVSLGIATNAITNDKMADNAIGSAEIINNSITVDDIGTAAVGTDELVADAVTTGKILNGTILGEDIATKTISADKLIADGVNDAGKVATVNSNGTVTYQTVAADVANITNGKNLTNGGDTSITIGGTALGVGTLLKDATVSITNLGVTNGKIAADAITTDKIATDAVQTSDIKDKNVTAAKLDGGTAAPNTVATTDGNGIVTFQPISTANLANKGSLTNPTLESPVSITIAGGNNALLSNAQISVADLGVTNAKLADNAVNSVKIANETILSEDIKDGEVTSADIKDLTITGADIATKTISADKLIADGVNDAGKVATVNSNGTVTYQAVSAANLSNGKALTSTDLSVSSPEGATALLKDVAIDIKTGAVTNIKIGVDAITTDKIKDGEVTSADIKDLTITGADIAGNTITSDKFNSGGAALGTVPTVGTGGVVTYQAVSTANLSNKGSLTNPTGESPVSITIAGGNNALLSNAQISVANGGVTAAKLNSGAALANTVATSNGAGVVTYQAITPSMIGGKADLTAAADATPSIEVASGGTNAVLVATSLRVKDGGITTAKLNSGSALTGTVATANGSGGVAYLTPSVTSANVSNAKDLTNGGDTSITIGGTASGVGTLLKDATVSITNLGVTNGKIAADAITTDKIAADAVQTSDIKDKNVTPAKMEPGTANQVMVTNPAGTGTVWANAAMPKVFYMPAVIFSTATNGTYTRDLYSEYKNQFTSAGNPSLIKSTSAPADIPYHLAGDLYYYITYYDPAVFSFPANPINANGVLTYNVIGPGSQTSYMNIVFVVK